MRTFLWTIIVGGIVLSLSWQSTVVPETSYLIESDELRIAELSKTLKSQYPEARLKSIYPSLGYYALSTPQARTTYITLAVLNGWKENGLIDIWHEDRVLELRTIPNDPFWPEQWDMDLIDMKEAWNMTTGGITSQGDTIVVAILDSGFDIEHPDLNDNYWRNSKEIPNDNIDNDQNGYVDDYIGLNIQEGNDQHPEENHGTSVSGIIGAVGNNNKGVSGVNWAVKILPVSGIKRESDLIEAYNYVKQFRDSYNRSNGEDGAFVVVTNSSLGIDGAFAEDHEMWCAAYDDMGETGILSVASTTNRSSLVDEEGDMPSTCVSTFLITVTNTDIDDELYNPAGYGPEHVDLGAPGENSLTTRLNNSYGEFGGTSAAAPHVSGAVALLYSIPCEGFMSQVKANPASAALRLRTLMLEEVDPISTLEGKTVTGGRLNVNSTMNRICSEFPTPSNDLAIRSIYPNPNRGDMTFEMNSSFIDGHEIKIYDSAGRLVFETPILPEGQLFTYHYEMETGIPGLYVAVLQHDNDCATRTFVVQ